MSGILDGLLGQLGGPALSQISKQIGADDATSNNAIAAALPVLMGALAKNASSGDGATALINALQKKHDGSILDDVAGALGNAQTGAAGAGILKHVLGDKQNAAAAGVAQASGLDPAKAGALLSMLAPVVMGALGKAQRSGGLDAGGLAAMLGQERQRMPAAAGGLLSMLDRDGDGSVVDDVLGMAGKFLGKR
ncbi:MAG: DUF937 domain-containing protein [Gemmatimonadaceae bacterium]|jgi:hypothetical protein|nr:DUF937 domain-containing protein [Gemmatimonadaceae bacterium]